MASTQTGVLCAGLSCVDMMLLNADTPVTMEAITAFDGNRQVAGGSCCNSSRVLAALKIRAVAVTLVGDDVQATLIRSQLEEGGVDTQYIRTESSINTSLAVLPVYTNGGRGCFVDLGANKVATPEKLLGRDFALLDRANCHIFHFGYPHLMKGIQGDNLAEMFAAARRHSMLVSLDVNGANSPDFSILQSALSSCFFFHANLEEAATITGGTAIAEDKATREEVIKLGEYFLAANAGIVSISLGRHGAYLATNKDPEVLKRTTDGRVKEAGVAMFRPAFAAAGPVNATAAGDSFVAGGLAYASRMIYADSSIGPSELLDHALLTAMYQVDSSQNIPKFDELRNNLTRPRLDSRFAALETV